MATHAAACGRTARTADRVTARPPASRLMESGRRRVVFVTGPPGAGKTTIAGPLALELDFALIGKDRIKELPSDMLGESPPDLAWSQRLGAVAMELLWELARYAPAVVLDANFRPGQIQREQIDRLGGSTVELRCACPPEIAARRYNERAASRHRVHVLAHLSGADLAEYARPLGARKLLAVDTTVPVDIAGLARRIRTALGEQSG
jgi:predicted kinase